MPFRINKPNKTSKSVIGRARTTKATPKKAPATKTKSSTMYDSVSRRKTTPTKKTGAATTKREGRISTQPLAGIGPIPKTTKTKSSTKPASTTKSRGAASRTTRQSKWRAKRVK